jgi:thioredoxin 1
MKFHFQQIAQQNPNVIVLKVDVDQCQDLAAEFSVSAMPTFIFIKNMHKLETVTGADAQRLLALVANLQ